jgi:Uma2 family endonuclease
VSDASLAKASGVKSPLYAQSGIAEVWIVDVDHDAVEQHTEPLAGRYSHLCTYQRGKTITSAALPHVSLTIDSILPEPSEATR